MTCQAPYAIDLRLLGSCNLQCPFCFGPRHELQQMPTYDIFRVIDLIVHFGVKAVHLSGGEPTLLRDLPSILYRLKSAGLRTSLSTNGLLLADMLDLLAPHLDSIALPIDSFDPTVNSRMRPGQAFYLPAVLSLMNRLRRDFTSIRIKLGTIVCRINLASVPHILDTLPDNMLPDVWKLYQVSYSHYATPHRTILEITPSAFENVVTHARASALRRAVPFVVYRNEDRDGKYLFIDPQGDAIAIRNSKEALVGNLLLHPREVFEALPRYLDYQKLEANFCDTYLRTPRADA